MGMYYELSVECGDDEDAANQIFAHFHQQTIPTTLGEDTLCLAYPQGLTKDEDGNWCCLFHAQGVTISGFDWIEDENGVTVPVLSRMLEPVDSYAEQATWWFYDKLREIDNFRHAFAGWNVDCGYTRSGWLKADFGKYNYSGFVANGELWNLLGQPPCFQPFKPGYYWIPEPTIR